jgi:glycosyltransferase involved in cell wall biosynthesis
MLGRHLGGLEQAALDYHDALTLAGHEVHTVIHPGAAIRRGLEQRGAAWHGLTHLGEWDLVAAARLRWLMQRLGTEASIAHGNRAMHLLRRTGAKPLIAVLPNYKMSCRGATAVFYPTLDLRRYAIGQGMMEDRLYHIPSMVAVPTSPPQSAGHEPPVIGAMGRFVGKKGFDVFMMALARLRSSDVAFRAVLAGDGPDRAALERLRTELHLNDMLALPGWTDDKQAFFGGIDLFCLPSHHEPFGIVLIEAMAQAKPIVATNSEGPSEILRAGTDGLVVPRGDAHLLAEALGKLIADPGSARRLAANAYRRAREDFALPCVAVRLDLALRRITGTGSRQASEVAL